VLNQVIANRYHQLRLSILNQAKTDFEEELPEFVGHIDLTEIGEMALQAHARWPLADEIERQIGWNWREARDRYRRDHMARIELAIWYDDELCGLMLGKASEGKLVVKINYVEGAPEEHPLKGYIVPIAARCAELFAVAIEANWVGIQDPFEGVRDYYQELGFDQLDPFDPRNNAMFKAIIPDVGEEL
jgi:hypothetical protein